MPKDRSKRRISQILIDISEKGASSDALTSELYDAAYTELKFLALQKMQGERRDHTLQPTALVHEAYMRLAAKDDQQWDNRAHFFGAASRAMMQVLRNHAAKRAAAKRGGSVVRVPFETIIDPGEQDPLVELSTLSRLFDALAQVSERAARVFEMRLIGGMTEKEIAHVLGISRRTVGTDWKFACYTARELLDALP